MKTTNGGLVTVSFTREHYIVESLLALDEMIRHRALDAEETVDDMVFVRNIPELLRFWLAHLADLGAFEERVPWDRDDASFMQRIWDAREAYFEDANRK